MQTFTILTFMENNITGKRKFVSIDHGHDLAKIIGKICDKVSKRFGYYPNSEVAVDICEKFTAINEIMFGDMYDDVKAPDPSFFKKMKKVFQEKKNWKEKNIAMVNLLREVTDEQKCAFLYNYLMSFTPMWDYEYCLDFFATVN